MSPKKLLPVVAVVSVLSSFALVRTAGATQPATDIGVIPPQGTPNQPPPNMPPPQPQYRQPQYQQPQYQQPQYQQPQYQQPQYQQPPPPYVPPKRSYEDGDPVPVGYHVEDRPRKGLVVGGWLLLLIPYGISALTAVAAKGDNQSNWLLAPVVGPWLMMGRRDYANCTKDSNGKAKDGLDCTADVFVVMGLILDGVLQASGATMLLLGYLNTKQELVHDRALHIRPTQVGTGYGLGLSSSF